MSVIIVLGVLYLQQVWSFDILFISTVASPSHDIWDRTLMMALHERGHNITMLTHEIGKNERNLTFIHLEGVYDKIHEEFDLEQYVHEGNFRMITIIFEWLHTLCKFDLETNGMHTLIKMVKEGRKFDLVVMDILSAPCVYPLLELMGSPPMVGTSPFGMAFLTFTFGTAIQSAYIPLYLLPYTDNMNFAQRSNNFFYVNVLKFWNRYMYFPDLTTSLEEVYGKGFTPLHEFEKNVSILLVNYDPLMYYPQILPPNIIPVGGLHVNRAKEISKDIKTYLDESKNGVILFSLGTNIRSDKLGPIQMRAILNTFARLKENVIWKFESDMVQDLPMNVKVYKWLPQNDIQAHHNLRLFITHGGALSTQEAMYHGVPVVGIPFLVDQRENMHRMTARKLGKKLDYNALSEDNMFNAIREVIDNPIYKKNAEELSLRFRDQPQSPLDRAVFWVEYTGRHRGAQFLNVRARNLNTFQLLHLDLFALILFLIVVFYFVVIRACYSHDKAIVKKMKLK